MSGARRERAKVAHSGDSEGGEEPWLVSYADLMTLLFGFFAMLFTYASFEEEDMVSMRKDVAKYFGGTYVAPAREAAGQAKFEWGRTPYPNEIDLRQVEEGLEINFITSVLFESGKAVIQDKAEKPLKVLIELIKAVGARYRVQVEGHTDDNPISSSDFPSNWELSAARAAAIVRLFEKYGFSEDQLGAIGFGSSRPAYPNRDPAGRVIPENQAHNRRVVIKVILPKGETVPEKVAPPLLDEEAWGGGSRKTLPDPNAQ